MRRVPLILGILLALVLFSSATPAFWYNPFDASPSGWMVYDYNGTGGLGGNNVWYPVGWQQTGGINDTGYIIADDSKWRIDELESPMSVLPLIIYWSWFSLRTTFNLGNVTLALYLRGHNLDLKGATVHFWVFGQGSRYHHTQPLVVPDGVWSAQQFVYLSTDPAYWHNSWNRRTPTPLATVLRYAESWGISFVGFSEEPTGELHMDEIYFQR